MKTIDYVKDFMNKHPMGVYWWRCKKHSAIIDMHLNPGEEVTYAFAGQKNNSFYDIFNTYVIAVTNKRILLARKRLLFGYFLISITPDLFNDLSVYEGLIWGKVVIDTVKEEVYITNLPKSGLREIETKITDFMMEEKKKYGPTNQND